MSRNEGVLDRVVRGVAGTVLVGLTAGGLIGAWGWIGVVPLVTAVVGWCPLYSLLGVNTCSLDR